MYRLSIMLLLFLFIGWNILYFAFLRRSSFHLIESLALSYGLGVGFVTLEMLAFSFFGVSFELGKIIAPWVPLFFINALTHFKEGMPEMATGQENKKQNNVFLAFLLAATAFQVSFTFFRALIRPLESYDAIAIYAIKAKIIYIARSIPADFFGELARIFPHPDYPINIPLAEVMAYLSMGSMNDQLVKLIFPLFFIATLCLVYYAIRRFSTRTYALLFAFLLASIPQFSNYATNGYHDMVLSFYTFGSVLFLLLWFDERSSPGFLILSAIMAGLAGWTKNEGLLYCVTGSVVLFTFLAANRRNITKKEIYLALMYIGIIIAISSPWAIAKARAHITNQEIDLARITPSFLVHQLYKIKVILYEFQKEFFGPKKWLIVWPVAAFAILSNLKKAFGGTNKYIALSLFLTISGYILFYMISSVEVSYFVSKTWARFLLHFLPLVIYWMAVILKEDIDL
jgi:hypothetical protein